MKNHIDSNFAIAIFALVASCVDLHFGFKCKWWHCNRR